MSLWHYDCQVTVPIKLFVLHGARKMRHDSVNADVTPKNVVSTAYLQKMDELHQLNYSKH